MNKYEQLIEFIINEQEDKAKELFHQIVVEKSRDIYESLIDEQDLEEVGGNDVEEMVDEITMDEQGMAEGDEEFDVAIDDNGMGDEEGGEEGGDIEDRVMDLEDALDELKAEFDALMGGEGGDEENGEEEFGSEEEFGDEESDEMMYEAEEDNEEDEEDVEESVQESKTGRKMTEAEWIREYVEKVGDYPGNQANPSGAMAGTGAKSEKQGEKNTKSPVGPGANMGGKVVGKSPVNADPDGKQIEQPNNEYSKGKGDLPGAGKFKNTPGGDAGKSSFKTKEAQQGGKEGKLAGADGSRPINTKSPLKHIAGK